MTLCMPSKNKEFITIENMREWILRVKEQSVSYEVGIFISVLWMRTQLKE